MSDDLFNTYISVNLIKFDSKIDLDRLQENAINELKGEIV